MKKIIYLLLLFIPLLTIAQNNSNKPLTENEKTFFKQKGKIFKGYVAAGLNFAQIDGDKMAGFNQLGANIGGGVYVTYSKKFSNSLEISYTMRGAKSGLTQTRNGNTGRYSWYQMDYIELPLMFNYHDFKVAIFSAGFSYTQMIRVDLQNDNPNISIPINTNSDPSIYNSNLDVVAGVTFLFKEHWGLNFKYNYSLLNNIDNGGKRGSIFSDPAKNTSAGSVDATWYHSVLTFRAMYVF